MVGAVKKELEKLTTNINRKGKRRKPLGSIHERLKLQQLLALQESPALFDFILM